MSEGNPQGEAAERPENKPPELDSTEGPNANVNASQRVNTYTDDMQNLYPEVANVGYAQYHLQCQICGRVDEDLAHKDDLCGVRHAGGWTCGGRMALTQIPGTGQVAREELRLDTVAAVALTLDEMGQAEIESRGALLQPYHNLVVLQAVETEAVAAEERAAKLRLWKRAYTGEA